MQGVGEEQQNASAKSMGVSEHFSISATARRSSGG
jgi:hypothetical protein